MPPGPITPAPAPAPPEDPYVSDLSVVASGRTFARATADGAPTTDNRSSGGDQAVDAAASKDGGELTRSCGREAVQSHAQATAAFQPLTVAGVRQFGFTLSTTAYARGGSWRSRLVFCRSAHNTVALADASASGRLDLTFNPSENGSDQLIIRVSDATPQEAHLEVRDGSGRLLPLRAVPGESWVTATLVQPGPYTVRAAIAAHAENGGGGKTADQHARSFSVSVQSRRDALALGYGQELTGAVMLPLPVFMSADALTAVLDSTLFTDHHRLYPCAEVDCGSDRLRNVAVEMPHVSTSSGSVVLDMRLSGTYQFALIFGGGVSGTVRAMAVPVVEHDTLRFESPRIDVASHNLLVKWLSGSFERKLLDRIAKVRIDLTPRLEDAVAGARERLAVGLRGACLLLAPREAHVRSVQVLTTAPQGIVANFDLELSQASGSACRKGKALR